MCHTEWFIEMMPVDFFNLDFSLADEDILGQKFSQVDDEPWDGDWQMET